MLGEAVLELYTGAVEEDSGVSVELVDLAERADELASQARSVRTIEAYLSDWARFEAFCAKHQRTSLPAHPGTVVLWVSALADRYRPSTIARRLVAVSVIHQHHGHESPTKHPKVREVLQGVRAEAATVAEQVGAKTGQAHAPALTRDHLAQVLASIKGPSNQARRDRALFVIGFAGYFRRSELAAITFEQITTTPTGFTIHLPKSKTDQLGRGTERHIAAGTTNLGPAAILISWCQAVSETFGEATGPVFRRILKNDRITDNGISDRAIYNIITRHTTTTFGDDTTFSPHSLSRGSATTAAAKGADALAIARAGGWADGSATVARYIDSAATDTPNLGL